MQAAWYERRGPAAEVLVVGEMPDPEPGAGELRIRLAASGVNPGDVKKRSGWQGSPMPYPRVVPHSDGVGIVDAIGAGVDASRIGQKVWCFGAQSYRAFGTAAEHVVVPQGLAVALPPEAGTVLMEQAACLGIAGITGWRAVFADGSVRGLTLLIWGAASGVGAVALQMAVRDGARVLAVVRQPAQREIAQAMGAQAVFLADAPDLVDALRASAPDGVHRIAEVDFGAHIDIDAKLLAVGGVICAYASADDRPPIPYRTLGFADATLRLLGSDDFAPAIKARAASELTAALAEGKLATTIGARLPLGQIVQAHERVERGGGGRTLLIV